MDAYQPYREFHTRLTAGQAVSPPLPRDALSAVVRTHYPRLGIYTGGGSSHSWLWFAQVFERLGLYDIRFIDHQDIAGSGLAGLDVLAMSGGDTFAVAQALGPAGAKSLEDFIKSGGIYLGACAGAYLVMRSSKEPLNLFNFVQARITNLSSRLPQALAMSDKFCTAYGCHYVYHPVREEVRLASTGNGPLGRAGSFSAPLYGGPGMIEAEPGQVLARYAGFTEKTLFLVEPELAAGTLLDKAAVIRSGLGRGWIYLFGPHFEHPGFPQANRLLADAIYWDLPQAGKAQPASSADTVLKGREKKTFLRDIKRWLSNARIVAAALEDNPARWIIGRKVYEPAKFRVFMEAAWRRLLILERSPELCMGPGGDELARAWQEIALDLRRLKQGLDRDQDMLDLAASLFKRLNRTSARLLQTYFNTALAGFSSGEPPGRVH